MKAMKLVSMLVLILGTTAQADQGVTNDLPDGILFCQESYSGAVVLDGAKTLTLSRDQFSQTYLTVMQKDQFSGNSKLIENLPLTQEVCRGFIPCQSYKGNQGSTQLFVNFSPNLKHDVHLESPETGAVDFVCQK